MPLETEPTLPGHPGLLGCQSWSAGRAQGPCVLEAVPALLQDPQGFLWLEMVEPDHAMVEHLQGLFGLHELAMEDVRHAEQRPKLESFGEVLFLVLKPALMAGEGIDLGEVHVFIAPRFALLIHHGEADVGLAAQRRFQQLPERLGRGMGAALHAVLDSTVDGYLPMADRFAARLEELEARVIAGRMQEMETLAQLHELKRDMLRLRAVAVPLEEISRQLATLHPELITPPLRPYLRDVHDHLVRLLGSLDTLREEHIGLAHLQLALAAHQQNVVVRKLAGWGAILAVPTMLFSLYGMNFENMPELKWPWGYPLVLGLTVGIGVGLHRWFKRSGWL
ncbi:MAG: magnesium and cobalt transport protein CorA [Halothiobacillaceae bacterium]